MAIGPNIEYRSQFFITGIFHKNTVNNVNEASTLANRIYNFFSITPPTKKATMAKSKSDRVTPINTGREASESGNTKPSNIRNTTTVRLLGIGILFITIFVYVEQLVY